VACVLCWFSSSNCLFSPSPIPAISDGFIKFCGNFTGLEQNVSCTSIGVAQIAQDIVEVIFLFVSISLAWFHMGQLFQRIFPRTSKLYMWRLDEPKLHATWQHLCYDLPFLSCLIVLDFSFADWSNSLYSAHW
jgi:hypothetical protein